MSNLFSPAHLDYGLDTLFGRIPKSVDCQLGLEPVEDDPYRFAVRVPAPFPDDLDQAKTVVVRVDGCKARSAISNGWKMKA